MTVTIGQIGYIAALAAYGLLALIYALRGRWGRQGRIFMLAALVTACWAGLAAMTPLLPGTAIFVGPLQDLAALLWILFLWLMLATSDQHKVSYPRRIRLGWMLWGGLTILVLGFDCVLLGGIVAPPTIDISIALLTAVTGLFLTETVFRSFRQESRWGVKYLCLAIGGIFAYDVFLFADALLFRSVDRTLLEVRGFVLAGLVPFFVINIFRSEARHLALGLSQQMVIGSTVVLGTGVYLGIMALAAYYIRDFGGAWGQAMQVIFLFGAVVLLAATLMSGTVRSYIRVFLGKHLLRQKYDYRREWINLIGRISASDAEEPLDLRVVKALADLVDSPAGTLWQADGDHFLVAATWNIPAASFSGPEAKTLAEFCCQRGWIIDLQELAENPEKYDTLVLPSALREIESLRFIVPLAHHDVLIGVLVLINPRAQRAFDWEDFDLLKMASRQAAGYLAEQRGAQSLAEAREFEKFNQRYAFVVHDIKNLVSQLSLVVRNFEKYGDRPDFQRDMIATVQSAVGRMNHLMDRLRDEPAPKDNRAVAVKPLIEKLVGQQAAGSAAIRLECGSGAAELRVRADGDRIDAILRHLFQNAADTSGDDGAFVVGLSREKDMAVIEVRDTGAGMDAEFIREKLFKPFRSTKRGGMGVGAFQCRAYARELGGDLEAISSVGAGTTMRVTLPIAGDL